MFKCSSCGFVASKWSGKCPNCGGWGTLEEVNESVLQKNLTKKNKKEQSFHSVVLFNAKKPPVGLAQKVRIRTGFNELDRILGGGALPGAVTLLGGEPGVGKSTLLLQVLVNMAAKGKKVLYISAEESENQVFLRLKRIIKKVPENLYIVSELNLESVLELPELRTFDFVVFDSIQAFVWPKIEGLAGGMSQTKAVVSLITNFAKTHKVGTFLIGQVTKSGMVAGPKTVEHIVDTVIYLEHFVVSEARIIRAVKNRFGEVGDIGFLKMSQSGFVDYQNALAIYVDDRVNLEPGAAFGVIMLGNRPLIVQVQALVNDSNLAMPRRVVEGVSKSKVEVLSAVINRRIPKLNLFYKDLFVKVLGGLNLKDAGVDLALVAAIVSFLTKKTFKNTAFIGEVDLLGNVKPTLALDARIKEAKKHGFSNIVTYRELKHVRGLV